MQPRREPPYGSRGCPLSRVVTARAPTIIVWQPFLRKQESIPGMRGMARGAARPDGCRGGSRTAPTGAAVVPAQVVVTARAAIVVWQPFLRKQESIPRGPARLGDPRRGGHDVVPPSFLRSLSSWKRGAGIHPHNRPNSPCKSPKIGLQIVDKAKAFAIPFRAVIP